MNDIKKSFIEFTLNHEILKFGNFTLNSGRQSPYFFNTGLCNDGKKLNKLASFYGQLIVNHNLEFDFIFGPAYKGIALATSISSILNSNHNLTKPYCFNRKEIKTHGDKGIFVGSQPSGNALIVDDVISSGKSIIESINLLSKNGSSPKVVVVAFDRMEIGSEHMASLEIKNDYNVNIYSIITLDDIINYLATDKSLNKHLTLLEDYIKQYRG